MPHPAYPAQPQQFLWPAIPEICPPGEGMGPSDRDLLVIGVYGPMVISVQTGLKGALLRTLSGL